MKARVRMGPRGRITGRGIVVIRRQRRVTGVRIVERLPASGPGFLTLERFRAKNLYRDGGVSAFYRFEVLHRRGVDAVAILPFYSQPRGRRLMVVCKIGFRPGLHRRSRLALPVRDRRRVYRRSGGSTASCGISVTQERGTAPRDVRVAVARPPSPGGIRSA